ncbi:MAG: flagellar basal body P-ring formation chaperone FlgA [Bacteroidota bacterium]
MGRFVRAILLMFILTCGLVNVRAANIPVLEIADRVIVPGPKIYLSDLGSIQNSHPVERLNLMVDLGPAPYPGQVRVFSRECLGLILKQKGFNENLDIRMGKQVEVRVESTCITAAQVEAAIEKVIPKNDAFIIKKWVEFRNVPAETWLSKGEWQINASPLGDLPQVGSAYFRVTFTKDNELKTINVSGKIRALGRVYQSIRDIKRHSLINESDFRLIEIELTNGQELLGRIPSDIRSTKLIKEGAILEKDHFQPLPLVIKGDLVNVLVKGGNIAVKMTGIAEKDGWSGDQIQIVNPNSKKKFQGRVIGRNLVEVTLL